MKIEAAVIQEVSDTGLINTRAFSSVPKESRLYKVYVYFLKRQPKGRLVWERDWSPLNRRNFFQTEEAALDFVQSNNFILLNRERANYWYFWFREGDI